MILIFVILLLITSIFAVEPSRPDLLKEKIGEDFADIVFVPGKYDSTIKAPVGNEFYVKYREADETDWKV